VVEEGTIQTKPNQNTTPLLTLEHQNENGTVTIKWFQYSIDCTHRSVSRFDPAISAYRQVYHYEHHQEHTPDRSTSATWFFSLQR
jgi:hypothetical protein